MTKPGKVFIFFNCDAAKSEASMTRKNLWKRVKEEYGAERIQIATDDLPVVEQTIIEGDPVEAGNFIQFGAIRAFECY